jgi:hypothetical protein
MVHLIIKLDNIRQRVTNLENIDKKTLEKTEGAAKSGQFRNMSHIGLKS